MSFVVMTPAPLSRGGLPPVETRLRSTWAASARSAATVDFSYPEYANDFPNGKGRLRVRSTGYAATLVNGEVVTAQGEHTGARPGRVIRDFSRG